MGSSDKGFAVFEIPDLFKTPDPVFSYDESCRGRAIVVDNGSYECKAGWSSDVDPRLVFRSYSTKVRGQKGSDIYVGNDIANYEASGWMPMKSPFEKNIATHPEIQEHIMDHIFTHLGFNGENDKIDHPIVMTEPLCNPNYYRQFMSELLFECYDVSSVLYGIDSLLSLEYNVPNVQHALVIGLGHSVSQVIPVVDGEIGFKQARRVSYGGQNISGYLQRLLQLKHPHLTMAIGAMKSEYLTHTYCRYALDYSEQVSQFRDPEFSDANTVRVQLPLNAVQASASATTTSGKMDVCLAIVHRVECVMSKRHKAKWIHNQETLKQLLSIQEMVTTEQDSRARAKTITDSGFNSLDEIEIAIYDLQQKVDSALLSELPPEVELCHFSDPDSWLAALRRAREDIKFRISQAEQHDDAPAEVEAGSPMSDVDMLDRLELIIFETEREFKRTSVINTDNLKSSSGISRFYQLLLGTERYRAPEILFQPSAFLGLDQAGLVETIDRVLQQLSPENQDKVAQKIFVTGGPATLSGLKERLVREIQTLRPFGSSFHVVMAGNTALDAWHGARMVALDEEKLTQFAVTKKDYDEFGPDYIKTYKCSNVYAPSPLVVRI